MGKQMSPTPPRAAGASIPFAPTPHTDLQPRAPGLLSFPSLLPLPIIFPIPPHQRHSYPPHSSAALLFPPQLLTILNLCSASIHIHAQSTTWVVSTALFSQSPLLGCSCAVAQRPLCDSGGSLSCHLHGSLPRPPPCLSSLAGRSSFYSKSHQLSSQFSI